MCACRKLRRHLFGKSATTIRYRDSKGKLRFKGGPLLKQTQTYPSSFGRNATGHIARHASRLGPMVQRTSCMRYTCRLPARVRRTVHITYRTLTFCWPRFVATGCCTVTAPSCRTPGSTMRSMPGMMPGSIRVHVQVV